MVIMALPRQELFELEVDAMFLQEGLKLLVFLSLIRRHESVKVTHQL